MSTWKITQLAESAGLTDVPCFECAGVHCDIRGKANDQLDLGILYSFYPLSIAGVFTQNKIKAAPVLLCQELLAGDQAIHGVVVNSGNANACTGELGMQNAREMIEQSQKAVNGSGVFLVCSTGRIGRQLPMDHISSGIQHAANSLDSDARSGLDFANCILTSDTRNKKITVQISIGQQKVTIAGVAKGAGMIRPDMATMLAFITTDLNISSSELQGLLSKANERSFNAITIDGDMSTNDTVLAFANGVSGVDYALSEDGFKQAFAEALQQVCEHLAYLIVGDGEKITKVVTLEISGAKTEQDARKVGYAIAHSPLVKSSWAGSDPNWGRLVAAAGYSGAEFEEAQMNLQYNDTPVYSGGQFHEEYLQQWKEIVSQKEFTIQLDLGAGDASAKLITSDLTPEYITFNMSE